MLQPFEHVGSAAAGIACSILLETSWELLWPAQYICILQPLRQQLCFDRPCLLTHLYMHCTNTIHVCVCAVVSSPSEQGINDKRLRAYIALQAAYGMEYLHLHFMVHFDLKCDNLLCDLRDLNKPVVKIGDLGLSKQKKGSFISGNMRGTLPW